MLDKLNGAANISAGLALAMLACTPEQTPTEPFGSPSLAAAAKTYTAVDLGTLGGNVSEAFGVNPQGRWWERAKPTRFCGRRA